MVNMLQVVHHPCTTKIHCHTNIFPESQWFFSIIQDNNGQACLMEKKGVENKVHEMKFFKIFLYVSMEMSNITCLLCYPHIVIGILKHQVK